ncbi:tRNA lysidine(34) synthetase TilS [Lactobacillus intestinalis]|uniref:tRNA lysidine(34) synthetase TilS n=1 Tax=Lactobacillus intestinalis TaxID=151781 RepID=UPI0025A973DA|nr:tRNA lysidine(34) synthetase TilS [Lactobacillus intestinalis]
MKIIDFFKNHHIDLKDKILVVASSAGPDSMALAEMLNSQKEKLGYQLVLAHFDHQLRDDSFTETELLEKYCHQHGIKFFNKKWAKKLQPAQGIEAAARIARYDFLTKVVKEINADYLLTAHHGDDLLENILLKLIRSGNPEEMNSLQEVGKMNGVPLLRPLLSYSKKELLEYDKAHRLNFIEDSTNQEDSTMRNRLRHHIVPFLKAENPDLLENALRYSHEMSRFKELADNNFQKITPQKFLKVAYRLEKEKLASFNVEERIYFWQNFIWRTWHERVNQNFNGYLLLEYQGYYYLSRHSLQAKPEVFKIEVDRKFDYQGRKFVLSEKQLSYPMAGDFWMQKVDFWAGSLLQTKLPLKNGHHVKSKKKFAQAGIPQYLRPYCLTIYANQIPVFVEKTYQSQLKSDKFIHYYVYEIID